MKNKYPWSIAIAAMLSIGVVLAGCSSSNNDNILSDRPNVSTNPPTVPGALRAIVYSSSTIELAWNEATDNTSVVEYLIYRDSNLIATQSTLRFFEDTLTPGTTHTYQVIAIDDEGNLSDPAEILITTLDDGPIISEVNYSVILPYVIDIANGILIDDILKIVNDTDASWLSGADSNEIAGLTFIDQAIDETEVWRIYNYECEFGGAYEFHSDTFIQFGGHFKGYYNECLIGANSITGDFDRQASVNKSPPYNEILTSQYNITVQNDALGSMRNLTGQFVLDNSQIDNRLSVTEASYYEHNLLWSTTISDIDVSVYATDEQPLANYAEPFKRSFDASFRAQGPQTNDEPLTVVVAVNTENENNFNYQSGSLEVTAEDGSSMSMIFSNSDLSAFQLSFSQAGSSTTSTVTWSEAYRLLCLHTPTFDTALTACE